MSTREMTRFITGLRSAGWDEKAINDLIVFIGTGEEKYKPNLKNFGDTDENK